MTKGQHSIKSLFLPLEYLRNVRLVAFTFVKHPAMHQYSALNLAHYKDLKLIKIYLEIFIFNHLPCTWVPKKAGCVIYSKLYKCGNLFHCLQLQLHVLSVKFLEHFPLRFFSFCTILFIIICY